MAAMTNDEREKFLADLHVGVVAVERPGRFALTAQDERPPYRYVTVEGDVTVLGRASDAEVRQIAIRYLGQEAGNRFTDENLTATSVLIRMRPRRWLSMDYEKE
jgi:hypothetical protein